MVSNSIEVGTLGQKYTPITIFHGTGTGGKMKNRSEIELVDGHWNKPYDIAYDLVGDGRKFVMWNPLESIISQFISSDVLCNLT